jgi:hypothetical protein
LRFNDCQFGSKFAKEKLSARAGTGQHRAAPPTAVWGRNGRTRREGVKKTRVYSLSSLIPHHLLHQTSIENAPRTLPSDLALYSGGITTFPNF